ncbi:MAG TPA: sigma 54-interacting transcriptional regulator [Candidatus Saccharimonadales bacterium]|jgi:transcriptional regulator with PAS, ATPase and Fis domain|nr:sigma 54-interacting transcriptional regulator [Candidatus Saccharimonadales bacterium]
MDQSREAKPKTFIPIPFSKCDPVESNFLMDSLAEHPSHVVLLGLTGTGKSSLAEELYVRWRKQLPPEEVRRREDARERMLDASLDKRNFESKDHKTIEEYRRRIPTLKTLPTKPVHTNLVAAREDVAAIDLFGTLPGTFTDVRLRIGRIVEANQSMLFIDELGYVPKPVQAQLLTTVQERRFIPVGGTEKHEIRDLDVWYVAALTPPYHSILPELFYRLGSFVIELLSLDEIKCAFPGLMENLVERCLREEQKARPGAPLRTLSPDAMSRLREQKWPGNLRQLENVIHRTVAVAATRTGDIDGKDIDRAVKFDPANYLATNDIISRIRDLFREGAFEGTPLTKKTVDAILVEAFESEVGREKAMDLLKIGAQAFRTAKGKPRNRSKEHREDSASTAVGETE